MSHHAKAPITTIEIAMLVTSVTLMRTGPSPGMISLDAPGSCCVPPPMKIWKM